jgi:hypothetical protein
MKGHLRTPDDQVFIRHCQPVPGSKELLDLLVVCHFAEIPIASSLAIIKKICPEIFFEDLRRRKSQRRLQKYFGR